MQEDDFPIIRYQHRTYRGQAVVSLRELARAVHCHQEVVQQLVDRGVVEPQDSSGDELVFTAVAVERLGRGLRLRRDLGIGVNALPLILDLLERIDELEAEVKRRSESDLPI